MSIADSAILQLPKVDLSLRQLLPEYSGIYYVIDENDRVWYVGQATNIHKRWQGKTHHRIYQLIARKQQKFTIYYEQVDRSQLDTIEKQRIQKYSPHLNTSPVKTKKIRPTETLLRETIIAIADFAFILGVEPKTKTIMICLDKTSLEQIFRPDSLKEERAIIKAAFINRKSYINKWRFVSTKYHLSISLPVNGYEIKVRYWTDICSNTNFHYLREDITVTLAKEPARAVTAKSLSRLQQSYADNNYLQMLIPYDSDLIKLFFDEAIDREAITKKTSKVSNDFKIGKRGLGSRSQYTNIDELLVSREIDPQKYNTGLRYVHGNKKGLCVRCFSIDLNKTYYAGNSAYGIMNNKETAQPSSLFDIVYLLAGVDIHAWLLVEEYLQDFAKPANKLCNGEGYIKKAYVSARKFLTPAKVKIELEEIKYSAWIPFGLNPEFSTFEAAKEEIKRRLQKTNLPSLKLAFKKESITK